MKTAVLISGRGSNLQAILEAENQGKLGKSEISIVISNNSTAKGLLHAKDYCKKIQIVDSSKYSAREEFENELRTVLKENRIELLVLAGFMKILSPSFVRDYPNKIINIHPSLLPSFPGLGVQQKALDYGVKISGCTVHFVNADIDAGPIIAQRTVEIFDDDTSKTLSDRILKEEHKLFPEVISLVSKGKVVVEGRKVRIL